MATVTLRPFGLFAGDDRRHRRARRAARLPHPDDDRRPAVGDRHRRHGPRRAVQRPGDERPRRRGVRRRRRHPARQDRHDHLRQPPRRRASRRARASPRRRSLDGRAPVVASDDETPEGRSIVELARTRLAELGGRRHRRRRRPRALAATIAEDDPVHGRDPHERRPHCRTAARPQGRGRRDRGGRSTARCPAELGAVSDEIAGARRDAARDPPSTAASSASSSSRTPSRTGSPSGSPSSAGWASGP